MAPRGKVIPFPKSPPPPPPPAPEAPDGLVEIWRCRNQAEALVIRSVLDSEGISSALRSNLSPSVHPFSVGYQACAVILVPAPEAERARRTLTARRRHLHRVRPSPEAAAPPSRTSRS